MPWGAEAALRAPGGDEARGQPVADGGIETVDGDHRTAVDARRGRDARDARFSVDQHRAAAALPLRRAPVLHRKHPEPLPQDRQERLTGRSLDLDLLVVAQELHPMPSSGHGQAG